MRVVAGKHRGRRLAAPRGRGARPTSDRVREALFDVLAHNAYGPGGVELPRGVRVVDAFAASGALGFEALSRGASHVTFFERDARALDSIRANARALGETGAVTVVQRDATRPGPARRPCALVFLDPPYRSGLGVPALEAFAAQGWLDADAICAVELAAREAFAPPDGFEVIDERHYGGTRLVILRWRAATRLE